MGSFFISYTKPDEDWARWVDRVLRANGHDTTAMFADMGPGKNWGTEMHRGLENGARVILLLSEAALRSKPVTDEWTSALEFDEVRVIPLRVRPCRPEGLLKKRVYVDLLTVTDQDQAARLLRRAIDPAYDPRAEPAPFPNAPTNAPFPAEQGTPGWPEIAPPGLGLDREVVGRELDVAELRAKLKESTAAAILPGAVVKGAGGMGKSTLARYYIKKYGAHYRGIWWVRAEDPETVVEDLSRLAPHLGIPAQEFPTARDRAQAVLVRLAREPGPWLLVYDNAERQKDIKDLQPGGGHVHLLVTSREGGWPKSYAVQGADRLEPDEAVDLLLQESERADVREGAARLAAELDGLPLAIVNAGAWLRDTPSESFDGYARGSRNCCATSRQPSRIITRGSRARSTARSGCRSTS